jgi:predicted Zn-dependent peptidase
MHSQTLTSRFARTALLTAVVAAGTPAVARAQFPAEPPTLAPLTPLVAPTIIEKRLPNGLTVWIVEQHELPLVDVLLLVRTGPEGTIAGLHAPTAALDSALALMADVALRPDFPAEDFERLRKDRLTSLLQVRDRGPVIASRLFPQVVYGPSHPYGRPADGTEASTQALTRDDLVAFHRTWYRPGNAVLIVAGDVEPNALTRKLMAAIGAWPAGRVPELRIPATPTTSATRILRVDKPGAPQASFRIGGAAAPRTSPDAIPIEVLNTVLGGSFTSRLNDNLREKKGYTYGAFSGYQMRRRGGNWIASSEVVSAKADSALLEFVKELRAIREPVPTAELEKATQYLQRQLPGDFETTGDVARQLRTVAQYGLPRDYWAT